MADYNLVTYLLVLLSLVAAVLAMALVDSYGQINRASALSLRSLVGGGSEQVGAETVLGDGDVHPSEFIDYPVVNIERPAGNEFGSGARYTDGHVRHE